MAKQLKIVFQGEYGANSEIAARAVYPDCEPVPCPTFEDCFAAMDQGLADLAMIPIDNSLAGRVADIHHLLPRSRLFIIGEYFLPIRFQLMAVRGATLDGLKTVESHVHALGQCRGIIGRLRLKAKVVADTAGGARIIAESGDPTRAALAPRLAAELYGLDILAENVEDAEHNTTRFIILSREPAPPPQLGTPTMTTFIFRVRNMPTSLYKATMPACVSRSRN